MCQFFTQTCQQTLWIVLLSDVEVRVTNCISGDVDASVVPHDRNGTILSQLNAKDQVGQHSE
jgi:hypothetical protein